MRIFALIVLNNRQYLPLVLIMKRVSACKLVDVAVDTQSIELHSASLLFEKQSYFQSLVRFGIPSLVIADPVAWISNAYGEIHLLLTSHLTNQFIHPCRDLMQRNLFIDTQEADQRSIPLAHERTRILRLNTLPQLAHDTPVEGDLLRFRGNFVM